MDLYILNKSLTPIAVVDSYESLIWTKRYYTNGDFEIYIPASVSILNIMTQGNYIKRLDDDRVMMIERIQIQTDVELGNFLICSGRSVEALCKRRIVWKQTNINGNAETGIRRLVNENIISPSIEKRKIPNFTLGKAKGFTEKIEIQSTGDIVEEVISTICKS
ncbi:MAG: hypothetical protein IIX39_06400, partial [Clostridia bacterium]|nr:hypothetical protein [Clostridia bacterium]